MMRVNPCTGFDAGSSSGKTFIRYLRRSWGQESEGLLEDNCMSSLSQIPKPTPLNQNIMRDDVCYA